MVAKTKGIGRKKSRPLGEYIKYIISFKSDHLITFSFERNLSMLTQVCRSDLPYVRHPIHKSVLEIQNYVLFNQYLMQDILTQGNTEKVSKTF